MNKLIILGTLGLLLVFGVVTIYNYSNSDNDYNSENGEAIYQGPVPLGYDLDNFRKTGITIKEINN